MEVANESHADITTNVYASSGAMIVQEISVLMGID